MARAQRLLALLQRLRRHRQPISGAAIAVALGISLRTLHRDTAGLQSQWACIDRVPGLGDVMKPGFTLPPLMFSADVATIRQAIRMQRKIEIRYRDATAKDSTGAAFRRMGATGATNCASGCLQSATSTWASFHQPCKCALPPDPVLPPSRWSVDMFFWSDRWRAGRLRISPCDRPARSNDSVLNASWTAARDRMLLVTGSGTCHSASIGHGARRARDRVARTGAAPGGALRPFV
jgi:hypothetical protein